MSLRQVFQSLRTLSNIEEVYPFEDERRLVTSISKPTFDNPHDKPRCREVEFSENEVPYEEDDYYRQPDHGCIEAC